MPSLNYSKPGNAPLFLLAAVGTVALVLGAWHAGTLSFVNDDAFISFRYAKHFAEGQGLVYNVGERVEGYTNFLWTMILAGGMRLGLDPVPLSMSAGILFHLCTIALCVWFTWQLMESRGAAPGGVMLGSVPLAALALAVHRDVNVYATSGLETAMFTFFVLLAYVLLTRARSRGSFLAIGIVFVLLLLTRPDGIVVIAAGFVYVMLLPKDVLRRSLLMALPLVVLYLPYWCWRYSYYGFPFPNTYYAKTIGSSNYGAGLTYVWLYVKTYYALFLGLTIATIWALRPMARAWRERGFSIARRAHLEESFVARGLLAAVLLGGAWMAFVVRIGGDFMFARFLVPITPVLFLAVELFLTFVPARTSVAIAGAIIVLTYARCDQYREQRIIGYVADEWQYYPADRVARNRVTGLRLRSYFTGVPLRLAFGGTEAQAVYYADPDVAIEYETGLTDVFVAHQPLVARGRPGHEKHAPVSYLVERRINFILWGKELIPIETFISSASFGGVEMPILVYENAIMNHFAQDPSVRYASVPELIDSVAASFSSYSNKDLLESYGMLEEFYFSANDDRGRQELLVAELRRRGVMAPDSSGGERKPADGTAHDRRTLMETTF